MKSRDKLTSLYLLWVLNPRNETVEGKFIPLCVEALKNEVTYNVYRKGLCPSFLAPATFAKDALSLALLKFCTGVQKVNEPYKFSIWLTEVAHSAVVEELRLWIRRTKHGANRWEPLEEDDQRLGQ